MAVNINTVYQKVLALANKEQRGYITPQEFNLFADQAQLEIFHSYFKELNRAQLDPTKTDDYVDNVDLLKEKIGTHRLVGEVGLSPSGGGNGNYNITSDVYIIESVFVTYSGTYEPVLGDTHRLGALASEISQSEYYELQNCIYLQPIGGSNELRPIFFRTNSGRIQIEPRDNISVVQVSIIKKPTTPKWTYVVVNNKALYNASATDAQNFDLHESEENNLVMRILELSGITIKDNNLNQIALRDIANTKAQNS